MCVCHLCVTALCVGQFCVTAQCVCHLACLPFVSLSFLLWLLLCFCNYTLPCLCILCLPFRRDPVVAIGVSIVCCVSPFAICVSFVCCVCPPDTSALLFLFLCPLSQSDGESAVQDALKLFKFIYTQGCSRSFLYISVKGFYTLWGGTVFIHCLFLCPVVAAFVLVCQFFFKLLRRVFLVQKFFFWTRQIAWAIRGTQSMKPF